MTSDVYIHPTAEVSTQAQLGAGTRIWHHAQVREGVRMGSQCIVGKGTYIDFDVHIGDNVKIQNYSLLYHGATVEDGVFIGPRVCLTNDKMPRAITPDGALKGTDDWEVGPIVVRYGASLGAGSLVLPGVTIGRFAMVGAGAVVTRDVPDFGLVVGQPARLVGYVCRCGQRLTQTEAADFWCAVCKETYNLEGAES
jgi:UDP-2-acetamido-3-amino-2,3-dideoxy-glucuronate N-acetyltransferase